MKITAGRKYLITTDNWFYAPDGQQYKAVYGTVSEISTDDTLGIKTNRHSSNWFLCIGNMILPGCQVNYFIQSESCELGEVPQWDWGDGKATKYKRGSGIYRAD